MKKIVKDFIKDLEAVGKPLHEMSIFDVPDLLALFHDWLNKKDLSADKRQVWLKEELDLYE